jgi:hypothetical protein
MMDRVHRTPWLTRTWVLARAAALLPVLALPVLAAATEDSFSRRGTAGSRGGFVEIRREDDEYRLYRGGELYEVKGIGGTRFLETAAAVGSNSVRTWGAGNAGDVLARAESCGMTVLLGVWLSHDPADYRSEAYRTAKMGQVQSLLNRYRDHPALLMWSLGNEINLEGADTQDAWRFVNQLARRIHSEDPNHPVISVVSYDAGTLENIARYAPDLDAVGINAYGALPQVWSMLEGSSYRGPYLVTEWGVEGHWEAAQTSWGRPIEPTSAAKAAWMRRHYQADIQAHRTRCLGAYVFLWGQKQERTPTWYSMLLPDLAPPGSTPPTSPSVDVMAHCWSGVWPANRAPVVTAMTVDGGAAPDDVAVTAGEELVVEVQARDPDDDPLTYLWELLEEPTVLGAGGSREPRPRQVARFPEGRQPVLRLAAPASEGAYRLFVYVLDERGHVGTANVPFLVD